MYSGAMMATPGANVLNLFFDLTDVMANQQAFVSRKPLKVKLMSASKYG
jgi:hypothetical protein